MSALDFFVRKVKHWQMLLTFVVASLLSMFYLDIQYGFPDQASTGNTASLRGFKKTNRNIFLPN